MELQARTCGRFDRDPMRPDGRRARRALLPCLAFAVAVWTAGCWPQPGWGPHRSGHNPIEQGLTVANVGRLAELWSVTVGSQPVTAPLVTRDGVHVVSGRTLSTYALSGGTLRWTTGAIGFPCGPPDCPDDFTIGQPSVRGDEVLVPDMSIYVPGGTHRFDAASGDHLGLLEVGGLAVSVDGDQVGIDRIVRGRVVYGAFRLLDLDDPAASWSGGGPDVEYFVQSAVTLGADDVFYLWMGWLSAYDRDGCGAPGCAPRWTVMFEDGATAPVVSDGGDTVYVADGAGHVRALDVADGSLRWEARLGSDGRPGVAATPTVGNGWLYVASTDGRLYAFPADGCGAATCEPAWAGATGSGVWEQPALAGGVLYVASGDGTISAYDAAGCGSIICLPLWRTATGSTITGAPAVTAGHLLVGTADGRLIAYGPS